ncbi:hypothetical protein [Glutamicibacter creatinolyticus]|uniref:hypothetical protein n=1 Tax=Glutamicibacter creatinolyticus TaxID=162496 RepID=UPI003216366F
MATSLDLLRQAIDRSPGVGEEPTYFVATVAHEGLAHVPKLQVSFMEDGKLGHLVLTPTSEDTVTLSREHYEKLLESSNQLNALENAGVDNWEGYGMALSELENDCE